ncbi:LysR family transcriptional regulator [Peribacillus sp. B-H-3]|uniref:LysR family transcriptional regulator n=1 Tax=Peribacillus sp. B-H-3 TaxID=3400420 RepID=UPI003B011BDD
MTLGKYEIFYQVVETGSLTKAGEFLKISQSAVSHAISSLEKELGFSLLIRNRGGISLTADGEKILIHIKEMMNSYHKLKQDAAEISGLETGSIKIGSFSSVTSHWYPGMLKKFTDQYPSIKVNLMEGNQQEICSWIADGIIDFGFVNLPPAGNFEVLNLKSEKLYLILPVTHNLTQTSEFPLSMLKGETLILKKSFRETVLKLLKKQRISPGFSYELEDEQAILAMVDKHLGVSILPEIAVGSIPAGVKKIPLAGHQEYSSIGLSALSFKRLSPAAEKFIATVTLWLNENYPLK